MKKYEYDCTWNGRGLDFGSRTKELREFCEKNPKTPFMLTALLPESRKMRNFYHGAVLRLWAYLDGADYKDWHVVHDYEDIAKLEFCPEVKRGGGKNYIVPGSTKGKLGEVIEKVIEMLEDQYGIDRLIVLNPKDYKDFINRVYADGDYDTYIEYLKARKLLK